MVFATLYDGFIFFSNKILVSSFIFFVGLLFAGVFEKFTRFILGELRVNELLKRNFRFRVDLKKIISKAVYYFFFFGTIILSLNNLGITGYVIMTWSLFIGGIFLLSLLLDVKDGIINIYYGFKFITKIHKNDFIKMTIIQGKIRRKTLLGITVTEKGEEHYIPNIFLTEGYVIKK